MVMSRDRCCVAVPLYNIGIYAILAQFAVVALVTGVLSFAAPYIVAVNIPSFGSYLLGALCIIVFLLQGWGFFGVFKEKPGTYRRFVRVNTVAIALSFLMALIWIILSITGHSKSTSRCIEQFITDSDTTSTTTDSDSLINVSSDTVSGHTLCSIFTWVQTGVMGGLWLALLIIEAYFAMMSRIYGTEQREDHRRYNSIYTEQRESYIRQSMLWDQRNSQDGSDPTVPPNFAHGRTFSSVSKSSALRNEVKIPGDDDEENLGNTSHAAFMDTPLYASNGKGGVPSPYDRPTSAYSTGNGQTVHFANTSRSNLAPENSSPAYVHSRNPSKLSQQQPANQGNTRPESKYDDTEDFTNYYAR